MFGLEVNWLMGQISPKFTSKVPNMRVNGVAQIFSICNPREANWDKLGQANRNKHLKNED